MQPSMASLSSSTTITTMSTSAAANDDERPVPPSLVPAQWQDTVRTIGMSECREAALSLSHAFATDAMSLYLIPSADEERGPGRGRGYGGRRGGRPLSAEDRWRLHVNIMTYSVASVALNGCITTIGPDYEGVALWLGPGRTTDGWWTALRSGLWRLHLQLSPEGHRRYYDELLPLLQQAKVDVMGGGSTSASSAKNADNCYYLLYLGTKPGARRRGYAQKLLEHMFAQADAEECPVYLESSSAANNRYYSKFGFEHKKDVTLVRGKTPVGVSIMVRRPQMAMSKKLDGEHV